MMRLPPNSPATIAWTSGSELSHSNNCLPSSPSSRRWLNSSRTLCGNRLIFPLGVMVDNFRLILV
jgi:hypothetical protein